MISSALYLNFFRNIKGRYDLFRVLFKWDTEYKKEFIVTLLAFTLINYSIIDMDSVFDIIALGLEVGILMMQLGNELSILPRKYRPFYSDINYTAQPSSYIDYGDISFLMSGVFPTVVEEKLNFKNFIQGLGLCTESPLSSSEVDDKLMLRDSLPYMDTTGESVNYIQSRHQVRYIAIRVADKTQHTTNGEKLALCATADALISDKPIPVHKSYYFDGLLSSEAFRSQIFRNNLNGEKEIYTDLTTYFPVQKEKIEGQDGVRFTPDFYKKVSGHIGVTSLLFTENRKVAMLYQGDTKAIEANTVALGGSGSMDYSDIVDVNQPEDLRKGLAYGMARELCEETGMHDWFQQAVENTMVTGFFRWVNRCGKPEFVGITKAGDILFSSNKSVDGDEITKFEEIPIVVNEMSDFHKVLSYLRKNKIKASLSSVMCLHRLTVIADYNNSKASKNEKSVYDKVSNFLFKD